MRNKVTIIEEQNKIIISPVGLQGAKGDKGDKGDTGENGTIGIDGKSAYEIAIENGFIGTESEWLASLVGDTGATGAKGDTGATGEGLITGGDTNQALVKIDNTNYNTQWKTIDKEFIELNNVQNIKSNFTANSNPSATTDNASNGYSAGSFWINKSNNTLFYLTQILEDDEYAGEAVWKEAINIDQLITYLSNKQNIITGAATTITNNNLATDKVVISNSNGKIDVSNITSTELDYLSGITDNIQNQIDSKQDLLNGTGVIKSVDGIISYIEGASDQYIDGVGDLQTFPTFLSADKLITEVYNNTGATLTKGTVIYINGSHGNLPTVTKAIATSETTSSQTLGIIQNDINDNNSGYIIVKGKLIDLNTNSLTAGDILYLSGTTAGAYTKVKPYAPLHMVYVGTVVRSHITQGVIEVGIQNGYEMAELHNVYAQSPTNNDGLFYNTTTNLWETKSIATAQGFTSENVTNKSTDGTLSANSDTLYCSQKAIKTYADKIAEIAFLYSLIS